MTRGIQSRDVQNFFHSTATENEPEVITCTVGAKPSKAQYFTPSVHENYRLFSALTESSKIGETGAVESPRAVASATNPLK